MKENSELPSKWEIHKLSLNTNSIKIITVWQKSDTDTFWFLHEANQIRYR